MNEVETHHLLEDNSFKSKEILQICISEEANLRDIATRALWIDYTNLTIGGMNSYVNATVSKQLGWTVHRAICGEGVNISKIPPKDHFDPSIEIDKSGSLHSPTKLKFVVPIIKAAVANNPGITYQLMREIMQPYAKNYVLTDSILQKARDFCKDETG